MYNMYCDASKNLVMFLPDGTSDADVLLLAESSNPEFSESIAKQFGCIDLIHKHATYSINDITPTEFSVNLNLL